MIGKGIKLSTGFDLNAKSPLDNREWFKTIAERDALPDINLYEGLKCFVEETKHNYQYIDGEWIDKDANEGVKEIEYGTTEPIDENISIWVDTTNDYGVTTNFSDALILEIMGAISNLNKQIADLKEKNKKLEERVAWLELNGGGSGGNTPNPPIEPDTNDIIMTNENNEVLTFEDGSIMCFDSEENISYDIVLSDENEDIFTFEDGTIMCFDINATEVSIEMVNENYETLTFEDGSVMCFDILQGNVSNTNNAETLIFEDGSTMVFEDGSIMCFSIEETFDTILINELEEMMMFENEDLMKF